ncbi:hypothetical protein SNEBB_002905 [Seison nebaliae]|nr:hypothetical protein SNEBB_002905 [Seison nebaliae]
MSGIFKCLPIRCNKQVETVERCHANLQTIPDEILRHTNSLEDLLLDANALQELPRSFYKLVHLRRLGLSDNQLTHFTGDIANLSLLLELDVSKNELDSLPKEISKCSVLQIVDVSSNPLQHVPIGLMQLQNLTQLNINDTALSILPNEIGSLTALRTLEIRENMLISIPSTISDLQRLESLDLGNNAIEELPNEIGDLNNLQELWLDTNQLQMLPSTFARLQCLQQLDLADNRLTHLLNGIGNLTQLTDLCLSQNLLELLPESMSDMVELSCLKLEQNHLRLLPRDLGNCKKMEELALAENSLKDLPESIGQMTVLRTLNIDCNQLQYLPNSIGNCCSITVLHLRDNQLRQLPKEIGNLKKLKVLNLSSNRLKHLPREILQIPALNALWLSENQSKPMINLQQDEDEQMQPVLTCYLLPQTTYQTQNSNTNSSNNSSNNAHNIYPINTFYNNSPQQQSVTTNNGQRLDECNYNNEKNEDGPRESVRFTDDPLLISSDNEGNDSQMNEDEESEHMRNFNRRNTPHPKELKAKHPKAKFLLQQSEEEQNKHELTNKQQQQNGDNVSKSSGSSEKSITGKNEDTDQTRRVIFRNWSVVSQENEKNGNDVVINLNDVDDEKKRIKQSNGNQQLNNDDNETTKSRLHRRDTPHHLKGKRIGNHHQEQQKHFLGPVLNENDNPTTLTTLTDAVSLSLSLASPTMKETQVTSTSSSSNNKRLNKSNENLSEDETKLKLKIVIDRREKVGGLGISIAGGIGSTPYIPGDNGIFVSRLANDGLAALHGIQLHDKIILVNGVSLVKCDHYAAVAALKNAGNVLDLLIERSTNNNSKNSKLALSQTTTTTTTSDSSTVNVNPNVSASIDPTILNSTSFNHFSSTKEKKFKNNFEEIFIYKINGSIGLSIVGGADNRSHPFGSDENRGVFISKITPGGSASKTTLQIGDQLIQVNSMNVRNATHEDAVKAIVNSEGPVKLLVQHHPPPPKFRNCLIPLTKTDSIHITVCGGLYNSVNESDPSDEGLFIQDVHIGDKNVYLHPQQHCYGQAGSIYRWPYISLRRGDRILERKRRRSSLKETIRRECYNLSYVGKEGENVKLNEMNKFLSTLSQFLQDNNDRLFYVYTPIEWRKDKSDSQEYLVDINRLSEIALEFLSKPENEHFNQTPKLNTQTLKRNKVRRNRNSNSSCLSYMSDVDQISSYDKQRLLMPYKKINRLESLGLTSKSNKLTTSSTLTRRYSERLLETKFDLLDHLLASTDKVGVDQLYFSLIPSMDYKKLMKQPFTMDKQLHSTFFTHFKKNQFPFEQFSFSALHNSIQHKKLNTNNNSIGTVHSNLLGSLSPIVNRKFGLVKNNPFLINKQSNQKWKMKNLLLASLPTEKKNFEKIPVESNPPSSNPSNINTPTNKIITEKPLEMTSDELLSANQLENIDEDKLMIKEKINEKLTKNNETNFILENKRSEFKANGSSLIGMTTEKANDILLSPAKYNSSGRMPFPMTDEIIEELSDLMMRSGGTKFSYFHHLIVCDGLNKEEMKRSPIFTNPKYSVQLPSEYFRLDDALNLCNQVCVPEKNSNVEELNERTQRSINLSFKDKKKMFENGHLTINNAPNVMKSKKNFQFLNEHEIIQLHEEEMKKKQQSYGDRLPDNIIMMMDE